jgi:uncharacterized protein YjbJ (UPF0337 family)
LQNYWLLSLAHEHDHKCKRIKGSTILTLKELSNLIIKGVFMSWDELEGMWEQVKGKAQVQWGKLTNDDLAVIKGKKNELVGKLQERYGYMKDKAEKEVANFMSSCQCSSEKKSDDNRKNF